MDASCRAQVEQQRLERGGHYAVGYAGAVSIATDCSFFTWAELPYLFSATAFDQRYGQCEERKETSCPFTRDNDYDIRVGGKEVSIKEFMCFRWHDLWRIFKIFTFVGQPDEQTRWKRQSREKQIER